MKILSILAAILLFCNVALAEEAGWSEMDNGNLINDNVIIQGHVASALIKVRSGNYSVVYEVRLNFADNEAIVDGIYEYVDGTLVNIIRKPEDTPWHEAVAPNEVEAMKFLRENAYKI